MVLPGFPCDFSLILIEFGHERYETLRTDTGDSGAMVGPAGDPEERGWGDRGRSRVRGDGMGVPGMRATHARA